MLDPDIWDNKFEAEKLIKKKKSCENLINSYNSSTQGCADLIDLYNLAIEEHNNSIINVASFLSLKS